MALNAGSNNKAASHDEPLHITINQIFYMTVIRHFYSKHKIYECPNFLTTNAQTVINCFSKKKNA